MIRQIVSAAAIVAAFDATSAAADPSVFFEWETTEIGDRRAWVRSDGRAFWAEVATRSERGGRVLVFDGCPPGADERGAARRMWDVDAGGALRQVTERNALGYFEVSDYAPNNCAAATGDCAFVLRRRLYRGYSLIDESDSVGRSVPLEGGPRTGRVVTVIGGANGDVQFELRTARGADGAVRRIEVRFAFVDGTAMGGGPIVFEAFDPERHAAFCAGPFGGE